VGITRLWDVWWCFIMRDLEAMRQISCIGRVQGWASWSFAPIAVSRFVEAGVSEGSDSGAEQMQGSLHYAAHDEAVLRSAEMTWLWE
jgi:hypothetical protein